MALLARRAAEWAAIFLTFAVAFTHFIAMGSVTLELIGDTARHAARHLPSQTWRWRPAVHAS